MRFKVGDIIRGFTSGTLYIITEINTWGYDTVVIEPGLKMPYLHPQKVGDTSSVSDTCALPVVLTEDLKVKILKFKLSR